MSRLTRRLIKQEDEIVISVIRKTLWSWFWPIVLVVILINLPFFLIYPLFQFGVWGMAGFLAILIFALSFLFRIYTSYYYTALLITNKRLIDVEQHGLFAKTASTILYGKIEDVNYKSKGLMNSIFRVGDIYITTAGNKRTATKLESVKYPSEVVEKIIQQSEYYLSDKQKTSNSKAIKLLKRIKRKVGERKFNELISD
jgi:uncharacterized membrane protein YdbT with pleckstrin-like domain